MRPRCRAGYMRGYARSNSIEFECAARCFTSSGSSSYKGSVWIDRETNRVLRIEMATQIPDAFPSGKLEMATDYEFVRFGDRQFLLPVHDESVGCQRDTNRCNRNAIDFRNCHKYSGESHHHT